jgi:hypothetical protein
MTEKERFATAERVQKKNSRETSSFPVNKEKG